MRATALILGVTVLAALAVGLALPFGTALAQATTYTVNTSDDLDDGACDATHCSLREAINSANSDAVTSTVAFNITTTDPGFNPTTTAFTIRPTSSLPTITAPVVIDGYTQPGASPNTNGPGLGSSAVLKIELDGSNAGAGFVHGLRITAASSTIRGLAINRFAGNGVAIHGSGATGNLLQGNFIGTDVAGTTDLGNSVDGVDIRASNNTVGGTTPGARNVISGNDVRGIGIQGGVNTGGTDATGNMVVGNFIGTDKTGNVAIGNSQEGVVLRGALGNTIGGIQAAARNVISGNRGGVLIKNIPSIGITGASQSLVRGNFIGTDVSGTANVGNSFNGVDIVGSSDNTIGGAEAGAANIIAFNGSRGVSVLVDSPATGNAILTNSIFSNTSIGIGSLSRRGNAKRCR